MNEELKIAALTAQRNEARALADDTGVLGVVYGLGPARAGRAAR